MRLLFLGLLLYSSVSSAALLEDLTILEAKPGPENLELKLESKTGPKGNYFFVDITSSDPEAFVKTLKVVKKMMQKNQTSLDLNILSFSASPNGSYYRSEGISFDLKGPREPGSAKPKKKN